MRLIRLGALVGSVMLLVATVVWMLSDRAALRSDQDAQATSAVLIADQSAASTVRRALAVAGVANEATDLDDLLASFDGAEGCIVSSSTEVCSGPDLMALAAFEEAAGAVERDEPIVVVDTSTDTLLVVARGDVTVVIQLAKASLISQVANRGIEGYGANAEIELSTEQAEPDQRTGPDTSDGKVVVTDVIALAGGEGSLVVTATIPDDVGLAGDRLPLYLALLALGTVLMALAGWTFLLDRRTLERRATTDELTGLVNRREFERQAADALLTADRFSTGVCVMLIDLNGFKQINDTLGHQFGDLVLQAAAERLTDAVRDTDVVGRWGGDEFVILLPGVEDGTAVRNSAERIGARLGSTPIVGDVSVSAAIGAALFPRHGTTLDDLVRAADVAMYGAKSTGVTHRLADAISTELADAQVNATGYIGPDRRRTPVTDSPPESARR